jgi:hypothetical protein
MSNILPTTTRHTRHDTRHATRDTRHATRDTTMAHTAMSGQRVVIVVVVVGGGVPGHEGEDEHPAVLGEEVRQERAQVLHLGRRLPHAVFPRPKATRHTTRLVRVSCACRMCVS